MSSQLYIGEKNALTFPVMCDGYLKIDYSDEVATQDYGFFAHADSFTVEAVITPFDINGFGWKIASHEAAKGNSPAGVTGVVDSIQTMPTVQEYNTTDANYQSHVYRPEANRITDKMMLFYNDNVQLYLQNTTSTTHNQPAEYKLGMTINAGTSATLDSNAVILSSLAHVGEGDTFHSADSTVKYEPISFTDATCDLVGADATVTHDANNKIVAGLAVYGESIPAGATIASITDSTHFELSAATTNSFTDATCDLANTDATVTHDANTSIVAGLAVYGAGIPIGATIASITDATHFELSAAATATATNETLTFGTIKNNRTLTFGLTVDAHSQPSASFTVNGWRYADDYFWPKQELFIRDGQKFTSIGTVNTAAPGSKTVTLGAVVAADLDDEELYTHSKREALYLLNSFHVAWAFDVSNGRMSIYLNGDLVATAIHSNYGSGAFSFNISAEDSYIGQDPNTGTSTQFMGSVHEFAFLDKYKTEFNSLFTLAPNYRDALLYYRFEEVDE